MNSASGLSGSTPYDLRLRNLEVVRSSSRFCSACDTTGYLGPSWWVRGSTPSLWLNMASNTTLHIGIDASSHSSFMLLYATAIGANLHLSGSGHTANSFEVLLAWRSQNGLIISTGSDAYMGGGRRVPQRTKAFSTCLWLLLYTGHGLGFFISRFF